MPIPLFPWLSGLLSFFSGFHVIPLNPLGRNRTVARLIYAESNAADAAV